MTSRARAASKAPKAKRDQRTRRSTRQSQNRRKSSTKFPPKPRVEDVSSDEDELPTLGKQRPSQPSYHRASEAYHADTEGPAGPRRFSNLYGHGHRFEEFRGAARSPISPLRSVLNDNNKRQLSAGSQGSSPKKVRFSPTDNQTKVFVKGSIPSPISTTLANSVATPAAADVESDHTLSDLDEILIEPMKLPDNPDHHLLNVLRESPQSLSLRQISDLFCVIQGYTEHFSRAWFGQATNENVQEIDKDMLRFPIHDLELKYPALYLTTANVLDASTTDDSSHGWLKFFAHPDYRQYLVYAILGEWLTQRIFKDTAFGLSPTVQQKMHEDVDEAYLYFESFVRTKERSKLVAQFFNAESAESTAYWLECEAGKLADELFMLLAPMHPWANVADQQGRPQHEFGEIQRQQMRHDLVELISQCAALNWSIVRSGEDGTIIRVADRLENGKRFWPTAPMHCINQDTVDKTRDTSVQSAVPVVKMTCWARIEAFVPHGLDMIQMAEVEEEARKEHDLDAVDKLTAEGKAINKDVLDKAHNKFCWECSDAKTAWDVLPEELWPTEYQNRRKVENQMRNADWRQKLERRRARQQAHGDSGGDPDDSDASSSRSEQSESDESSSPSTGDDEMHRSESAELNGIQGDGVPLRGSWVTYYSCLNPHQVYCEWAKSEPDYQEELKLRTGHDCKEPIRRYNGLSATIRRARANLPLLPRSIAQSEDFLLRLWNFYAGNNLKIEWGAFVILVIYGLTKARIFSFAGEMSSAAIHLALDATTQALAGAQNLVNLVRSATPLRSIVEQLQLLHAEVQGFLGRFQGALGYKWHEFTVSISNAIPRPNTTEIEQAIREAGAKGSFSALSVFDRARTGFSHMTEAAKSDLAKILTATTAAASTAASATTATTATIPSAISGTPGTAGHSRRFIDRIWGNLPTGSESRDTQSVMPSPSASTAADEHLAQSLKQSRPWIPSPSDVEAQLGNLDGTPIATPTSTALSRLQSTLNDSVQTTAPTSIATATSTSKEAGAWWNLNWLHANSNHISPRTLSTTPTPTPGATPQLATTNEDALSTGPTPHSEQFPSTSNKFRPNRQITNRRANKPYSKKSKQVSSKSSKIPDAKSPGTATTTTTTPTAVPTETQSTSTSTSTTTEVQPAIHIHINDKYRSAFDMLNRVTHKHKHTAAPASEPNEQISQTTTIGKVSSAPAAPASTDVASKITAKFDEMAEDSSTRADTDRTESLRRTITVRPPGETLVVEIDGPEREEFRRRWFNR